MKRRAIFAIALAASSALLAQQATPPPPAPARPITWPVMTEKRLDDGLTVVLVPLRNVPKITFELTFLTGRGTESAGHPGVAQLAGRVLTEGTATRSSRQLKEALRSIGGVMNASVDADATTITASCLSESASELLDLLSDVARRPAYPKDEVALARVNFAQEVEEQRSSPDFLAEEELARAIFASHPYGFLSPAPAAIARVTRAELTGFAASHYVPNNAHLIVVGDFEADAMMVAVERAFGSWPRRAMAPHPQPAIISRQKRHVYFVDRPSSIQSTILIGALAVPRKSPDYLPLRTANVIYGGAFYSRLTKNIRESKGYTYAPSSNAELRRDAGTFWTSAAVRNEVTGATILEMLYELDRMRIAPVTAEELESARAFSVGTMQLELETQRELADRINTIYTYDLARDFLQTFRARLSALSPADIQKAAAKYFDTYRCAIVVVGDYSQVKDQVAPFGDVTVIRARK